MSRDGCSGKRRHSNKTAACIAAKRTKNCAMNVYRCQRCKQWHIGKTRDPFRLAMRIEQILNRYDKALQARLRERDRSGEADETRSGSAEGERPVPERHSPNPLLSGDSPNG